MPATAASGRMDLSLRSLAQLYNSLDASPFHEKDLDADAEHFILSWVAELPRRSELSLVVHLADCPGPVESATAVNGLHRYFGQRGRLAGSELRALLRQGRLSLVIGLAFLALCLAVSEVLATVPDSLLSQILSQSLTVGGWVAMWRPLQIYLYDWWPLRRRQLDYRRLAGMPIELRPAA